MSNLLHISDCHLFGDTTTQGYGEINPYESLKQILIEAFEHPKDIDTVIVTGDISGDDSLASYQHFSALIEHHSKAPVYVIAGNHDNNPHFNALSKHHLIAGKPVALNGWHIHGLDTRFEGGRGLVNNQELAAIKKQVVAAPQHHHLLAMHHHATPSNSWMDKHDLANADVFLQWLDSGVPLAAIIHGHVHSPLRYTLGANNPIPVMGSPASCWQWGMTSDFALSNEQPGYQFIKLHDDGTLTCDIKRIKSI
ncbi:metallophosphoesterase [Alteromonas sp. 1_MG-2023]|uniref:metallophosphoesterase n=1 Tax=Alteromonas sp. 1_MG-2023 TaxID=3062669 RepID=UPI0026E210E5|nr:metallophosphoesterase [Alteromonas sp. 1_MG-2023]MDO6565754.1 metallophosphoesterase [Alteromonas sp. 1_MG-2023]